MKKSKFVLIMKQFLGRNKYSFIILTLIIVSELMYLSIFLPFAEKHVLYLIVALSSSALYIVLCALIYKWKNSFSNHAAWIFVCAGIVLRLSIIVSEPTGSDDIYRYIWDGKVQSSGINPYRFAPNDTSLVYLHSSMLPAKINFPNMKTLYPPFAQWMFWCTYNIGGESVVAFKVPLFLAECITMLVLISLLRTLKQSESLVAVYALCPLPIMQFMIDGHIDAIGIPFLVLFLLLWYRKKNFSALLMFGFSILTKLLPVILLPFIIYEKKKIVKLFLLIIPLVIFITSYLPYMISRSAPFESLMIFSTHWAFNGSIFQLVYFITQNNQISRIILGIIFLCVVLYLMTSKNNFLAKLYYTIFLFFILGSTIHPWYLIWLAVFLPLYFRWSGVVFLSLVNVSFFVVIIYHSTGVWYEPVWLPFVEYMPIALIVIWETHKMKQLRTNTL